MRISLVLTFTLSLGTLGAYSQVTSLQECIDYALEHHADIQQAKIDEQITGKTIQSKLADWYPQVNVNFNMQHYLQLPVSIFPDFNNPTSGIRREVQTGVANSSTAAFSLNQPIFNRDVLLAHRSARDIRNQAVLFTKNSRINLTADVSKAYYDVLLTLQQISIIDTDILRLERGLKDATNQYKAGIVDKTDYMRATIALNNSKASQRATGELLKAKYATLKNLMGYPETKSLEIKNDSSLVYEQAFLDTTATVDYGNRVEFQLLTTQKSLRESELSYNKNSYLPTVSAFLNYNYVFQNQKFSDLYGRAFPNSLFGISLFYPIFQGGKRNHNIKIAQLQLTRLDWDFTRLRNNIETEHEKSIAMYKGSLYNYQTLNENLALAREVLDVIQLQYKSGVKTYLDVIIAQNDLQIAQFNHLNALYQLLSSKIDVEKSRGNIQ